MIFFRFKKLFLMVFAFLLLAGEATTLVAVPKARAKKAQKVRKPRRPRRLRKRKTLAKPKKVKKKAVPKKKAAPKKAKKKVAPKKKVAKKAKKQKAARPQKAAKRRGRQVPVPQPAPAATRTIEQRAQPRAQRQQERREQHAARRVAMAPARRREEERQNRPGRLHARRRVMPPQAAPQPAPHVAPQVPQAQPQGVQPPHDPIINYQRLTGQLNRITTISRASENSRNFISTVDVGAYDGEFKGEIARLWDRITNLRLRLRQLDRQSPATRAAVQQLDDLIARTQFVLPEVPQNEVKNENCGICFENLRDPEFVAESGPVVALPCPAHHQFHRDCITLALRMNPRCPLDQYPVPPVIPTLNDMQPVLNAFVHAGFDRNDRHARKRLKAFLNKQEVRNVIENQLAVHGDVGLLRNWIDMIIQGVFGN